MGIFSSKAPPILRVIELLEGPQPLPDKRFWIMETVMTTDGPRDRITNAKFATREEADTYVARESQEW